MKIRYLGWALKIGAVVIIGLAAVGWAVMALWNWLAPDLFGWHAIGFVQAVGLLVLCRILFGGFGRGRGGHWRARMSERFERMSPEERERFKAGMRARCGMRGYKGAGPDEPRAAQGASEGA